MDNISVTLLTGFLGAGKTTLLKRLMQNPNGLKLAIIENEFSEENIDGEILQQNRTDQIIQISNGCICCSIREDLSTALELLMTRKRNGQIDFDHVVIEATGLADPGPIVQTFFADENIAHNYSLDSIVTLVDAKHAQSQLDRRKEIRRQIGFADRLIITKADLATVDEMRTLETRLKRMNPQAPLLIAHFGDVSSDKIFDIGGFDIGSKLNHELESLSMNESKGSGHLHDSHCRHLHHHDQEDDVKSIVFRSNRAMDPKKFMSFIDSTVKLHGENLLRYKGILYMLGSERRMFFQGVHRLFGNEFGPKWPMNETPENRLVFIGVDLPERDIFEGLEGCLA